MIIVTTTGQPTGKAGDTALKILGALARDPKSRGPRASGGDVSLPVGSRGRALGSYRFFVMWKPF